MANSTSAKITSLIEEAKKLINTERTHLLEFQSNLNQLNSSMSYAKETRDIKGWAAVVTALKTLSTAEKRFNSWFAGIDNRISELKAPCAFTNHIMRVEEIAHELEVETDLLFKQIFAQKGSLTKDLETLEIHLKNKDPNQALVIIAKMKGSISLCFQLTNAIQDRFNNLERKLAK